MMTVKAAARRMGISDSAGLRAVRLRVIAACPHWPARFAWLHSHHRRRHRRFLASQKVGGTGTGKGTPLRQQKRVFKHVVIPK